MIITYIGDLGVKAQIGEKVISFNPPLRSDGLSTRFSTDVALFSAKDGGAGHSYSRMPTKTFVADGPGEYEVGGVFIKGIGIEKEVSGKKKINTIYSVLFEDINLCHLGEIDSSDIKPEILEKIGNADILFVPITGGNVATPAVASKLATLFEPHITIPLCADNNGISKDMLKSFLKEEGAEGATQSEKLTIKKKDLEGKEGVVEVLLPQDR